MSMPMLTVEPRYQQQLFDDIQRIEYYCTKVKAAMANASVPVRSIGTITVAKKGE